MIYSHDQSLETAGKVSGVNFWAAPMFPLIFIFPCIKAVCGLRVLSKSPTASASVRANVASALPFLPLVNDPFPFFKSSVQTTGGFPFSGLISKWYT